MLSFARRSTSASSSRWRLTPVPPPDPDDRSLPLPRGGLDVSPDHSPSCPPATSLCIKSCSQGACEREVVRQELGQCTEEEARRGKSIAARSALFLACPLSTRRDRTCLGITGGVLDLAWNLQPRVRVPEGAMSHPSHAWVDLTAHTLDKLTPTEIKHATLAASKGHRNLPPRSRLVHSRCAPVRRASKESQSVPRKGPEPETERRGRAPGRVVRPLGSQRIPRHLPRLWSEAWA